MLGRIEEGSTLLQLQPHLRAPQNSASETGAEGSLGPLRVSGWHCARAAVTTSHLRTWENSEHIPAGTYVLTQKCVHAPQQKAEMVESRSATNY